MMRTMMLIVGGLTACHTTTSRAPREATRTPLDEAPIVLDEPEPLEVEPVALPAAIVEPTGAGFGTASHDAGPSEGDGAEPAAPATAIYALRSGETLDHFARWSGVPVEDIAAQSGLSLGKLHDVGTELVLEVDDDLRAAIDLARDGHHAARAERYLARRGGLVDHVEYHVRTGDTAWAVANDNGDVPVWLLEGLNPSVDLDRLRPGQTLSLPVTADMVDAVADATDPITSP